MSDREFELPPSWEISTLGEVAELVKDKVDPALVPDARYVGLEHVEAHTMRILGSGLGSDVRSAKATFRAGNVLYGKLRPYLNKVAQPNFDGICSTDFLVFGESERLDPGYLAQFLNQLSVAQRANHISAGVELPRVDWKGLSALSISFPVSKQAQRAIVRAIETARTGASTTAQHLAASQLAIDRFRQAVLASACSGRLTGDWREHNVVEFAQEALYRRRSAEKVTQGSRYVAPTMASPVDLPDLPESWCWAALPELGEMGRGKSKHRPRDDPGLYCGPYPFIQTGEVARSGGRVVSHTKTYNDRGLSQSRLWPENTVCITIAANIADSALLTYPCCFPDSVVGVIVDESVVLPQYLELFIRTARRDLAAFAPATAQANINLAILSQVAVALPPIEEQREIVRKVETLYQLATSITNRIAAALRVTERSKQSVLARAFRGELIGAGQ